MGAPLRRFFILFIFLIVTTEAVDNDFNETSSHDHRQSRTTGRIVKLYSGTRPEPILCAGEGFQKDPNNCAVFYRCMKSGNGKYTVFRFQCGPGTVYDPDTEVCNHPRSTRRTECGGYLPPVVDTTHINEIEGLHNEIPSPIISNKPVYTVSASTIKTSTTITTKPPKPSESTTIKREITTKSTSPYPWGSPINNVYMDNGAASYPLISTTVTARPFTTISQDTFSITPGIASDIPPSSSRDNICTSDGFMGDSENCRKFYRCVANQRGGYTRFEFSCTETTVWDDYSQICNHVWAVKRSRCSRQSDEITSSNDIFTNEKDREEKPPRKESLGENNTKNTIQNQLQISYGSKVTQTQTQIGNGPVVQNQTQIHYGDRMNQVKNEINKQNQTQIAQDGSAVSQSQTQIAYGNKGVQTQLQIDHSKEASQTQIQISESSTRKTSTSTRHANSEETSLHGGNKCTEGGFVGDANDCKKFYRCVDNGQGGYAKYEFSCGEGTSWDDSIKACNHEWAVKKCGVKVSTESTTHAVPTSTFKTTQSYYSTTKQTKPESIPMEDNEDNGYGNQIPEEISTTSTTTTPPSIISTTPTLTSITTILTTLNAVNHGECTSSGFIGDEYDCNVFYRCVENGNGGYTKHKFKCGEGTVWDSEIGACNHAWAVKKCGGTATPDISQIETTTEKLTTSSSVIISSTLPLHSTTEMPSYNENNNDHDVGYGPSINDISPAITPPKQPQAGTQPNVVCKSSGYMGDKNDCKKFYKCVDSGDKDFIHYEFTCSKGTVWDPKIGACNHEWAVDRCGESITESIVQETVGSSSNENTPTSSPSTTTVTTTVESTGTTECTSSGFMGDPKNCKKFLRCVDNGDGSYSKYEFTCGEGTLWDQEIKACNHAWAVRCGSNTDTDHHETTPVYFMPANDEGDTSYANTNSDISLTPTVQSSTEASKESSGSSSCVRSGYIGDKKNCKKFYRCVDDGKGSFIRYEYNCGEGTVWDQSIEACNHAWAVKECGYTEESTNRVPSQSPITSITSTEQGYPPVTENTSNVICAENGSSVICSEEGFMGDPNNCKKFYRCVDDGKGGLNKYEYSCGEGTYWNQEILACDHITSDKECERKDCSSTSKAPQNEYNDEIYTETTTISKNENHMTQKPSVSSGTCTSEGFYGDPNDCKKFYRCVDNGKGGYTKYDYTCGGGTVWDQKIQACNHETDECSTSGSAQITEGQPEDETNISTTTEKKETSSTTIDTINCVSEGFFAMPNNCQMFIRCVKDDKGGFIKYEFACAEGTVWVQEMLTCYHDTGEAYCSPQSISKPVTSVEHQQTTEKNEPSTTENDKYNNGNSKPQPPSGSDICTSEGYHGNKNNCRKFYKCVDDGKGGYTKFDFTCSEGTAWDSQIQVCNYIDKVPSCQGSVLHDEDITQSQTTQNSAVSAQSTSKSTTSTTQKTTAASKPSSESTTQNSQKPETCDSEGYFGSTQDCKKFYRCVDNGRGGYTKYDYVCAQGTIWDGDLTTCNYPEDVTKPSCKNYQDGSNTDSSSSGGSSPVMTESSSESQGQDGTTKKPGNNNVNCTEAGFYPNPNDCKKFYRCVDWNGDGTKFSVFHFECGEGTIWDPDLETCNHEESVYPPRDCSGSQSQTGLHSSTTESTSTTEEEITPEFSTQSTTEFTTSKTTEESSTSTELTTSSSTEQSGGSSSGQSGESTTQQSGEVTTVHSAESTTEKPTETTTQKSGEDTTKLPDESTSDHSGGATTEVSTETITEHSGEGTTEQLGEGTTEYLGVGTTEQSTEGTTEKPKQSTTEQPGESTTAQSGEGTTKESEEGTTKQPDASTTEQSGESTTENPKESTTEQPGGSTTDKPVESTTEQQGESTTEQTGASTTEQLGESTTSNPGEGTTQAESITDGPATAETTTEGSAGVSTTEQSTTEKHSTTESVTEINTENNAADKECPEMEEDQYLFVCPSSFRRHPKYCNLFYQCDENDQSHDLKIAVFTCPNNTIYDESQTKCVEESKAEKPCKGQIAQNRRVKRKDRTGDKENEPIVVTKDSYACPAAGYHAFEKDSECSPAFLKCNKTKSNKLRAFVYQCPRGFIFWSVSRRCEPIDRVKDCRRSLLNDWSRRWEIPVESKNVAWT